MYSLTTPTNDEKTNTRTITSMEVAEMVGKPHNDLLKDIRRYCEQFNEGNISPVAESKISLGDFWIESTYLDAKGEKRPCYLVTKKGCEFIAHKMTGVKGTVFTARYINRFHDMEDYIKESEENKPSLDSVNTAANILERVYRLAGTDDRYLALLVGSVYKEFGMEFSLPVFEMDTDKLYDQTMIANELGIMSTSGKPHAQAAGAIIEMLNVPEDDTISTPYTNHGHSGVVVQYKAKVLGMIREWLEENQYPRTIIGKKKKYSVLYR